MSKSQARPRRPHDEETHDASSTSAQAHFGPDILPIGGVGASDNSPTIITRPMAVAARNDETFVNNLRGRRLAHFELIEPIGVGGMAAVLRARDTQLDRDVALKILPPDMAADPEIVRRFHQEARSAAKLDHENIARVFYYGEDQGLHFIAFEFVQGENLRTILERRHRLPVTEAVHYVLQITAGLIHAAERGVVHRDIKPSNIIIMPDGKAKLVDMGLARSLETHSEKGLTQSGVTLGTFDYISPEQALEPRQADIRSDLYSLGCTFYHMLTGQPPVPEGTAAKKLHHHQHVAPIDPRQLNPDIPDEVAAVLARMMSKDPAQRYQHPEHVLQHLLPFAPEGGARLDLPALMRTTDAALPAPPRVRPLLLMAIAAVILVAIVLLHLLTPEERPSGSGDSPKEAPAPVRDALVTPTAAPAAVPEPPKQASAEPREPAAPPDNGKRSVRTTAELARALESKHEKPEITVLNDLPPVAASDPGLVYDNPDGDLTIAAKPGATTHLRINLGLTIKRCRSVTLRGLRFVFDGSKTGDSLAALKIESGALNVEECPFDVSPGPKGGAALALGGVSSCHFHLCVITLGPAAQPAVWQPASVVQLLDGAIDAEKPSVSLERCIIRGHGDLISVPSLRPFALGLASSLVVLDGSAVSVDKAEQQFDTPPVVKINKSTLCFSEPIAQLPASEANGDMRLLRLEISVALLASAEQPEDKRTPLVRVLDPKGTAREIDRDVVSWKTSDVLFVQFGNVQERHLGDRSSLPSIPITWDARPTGLRGADLDNKIQTMHLDKAYPEICKKRGWKDMPHSMPPGP